MYDLRRTERKKTHQKNDQKSSKLQEYFVVSRYHLTDLTAKNFRTYVNIFIEFIIFSRLFDIVVSNYFCIQNVHRIKLP